MIGIEILMLLTLFFISMYIVIYINNNLIKKTKYEICINKKFEEFKIVQISDLHNKNIGNKQSKLVKAIRDEKPNVIFITGDLIDGNRFYNEIGKYDDLSDINVPALNLIKGLNGIAPIYFVLGNHEYLFKENMMEYNYIRELINNGVIILDNKSTELELYGHKIKIHGVSDPSILAEKQPKFRKLKDLVSYQGELIDYELNNLEIDKSFFNILLSHRPEQLDVYSKHDIDIVFSGHAHGGQVRIPFIGGLFSPHQGVFPKYTNGIHNKNNTMLIVNRGIGNSRCPLRIMNRPEIVCVNFKNITYKK